MTRSPLLALALCVAGSVASAQAVNVTWKCTVQGTPTAVPVGDAAGHAYMLDQQHCTAVSGSIGGIKEKEGTGTEFAEATGDNGTLMVRPPTPAPETSPRAASRPR